MPSGSYMQVYVKCPFYNSDNGCSRIICDGVFPGSRMHHCFRKRRDFKLQLEIFCCERYQNCEVYQMLEKQFEEDEEE